MKIGVLIDRLNVGGVEKVAMEEVRALNDLGHDAELVVLRRRGLVDDPFPELQRRIAISYLDDRLPGFLTTSVPIRPFYFLSLFHFTYPILLPWAVKRREYDLIISHNSYTSLTALTLSWFKAIPYVMYVWDPASSIADYVYARGALGRIRFLTVRLAVVLDKVLAHNARAVFTSGDYYAKFLKTLTAPAKVRLLPPGRHPMGDVPTSRGTYLITVTAWKEGKRLEELLQALAELGEGSLKVAGRWIHEGYRQRIEQLIGESGLGDRVEITGELTEDELDKLYAGARAVVVTSGDKGFGLPALEGASNGCPFIMPSVTGAAAFFEDGVDGLLYPLGDVAKLRECLRRVLSDERQAYKMGHHGRDLVLANYTWHHHVESLLTGQVTAPAFSN
jgi:glycosyltransferase involved in cell wall biosynthesis